MKKDTKQSFETLTSFQDSVAKTIVLQNGIRVPSLLLFNGLAIATQQLIDLKKQNKKAIIIGNGGSAAIASHQSLDLWNHAGIRSLVFNDSSQITCMANDFGYENVFARPMEMFCEAGDCVIAISSSGASANILKAARVAENKGATVIGFSGFLPDNPLTQLGGLHFYVPSRSYGVVESAHFLLLHAIMDEVAQQSKKEMLVKKVPVTIQPSAKHLIEKLGKRAPK